MISEKFPAAQQEAGDHHDQEEGPAHHGEDPDELPAAARVFPHIDPVVDHGGQGADQGAEPGGIRAVDQPREVLREGI